MLSTRPAALHDRTIITDAGPLPAVLIHFLIQLAAIVLRTLHLEIRCRFIHGTTKALRAPYLLEQPYNDPDASILALNTDLISFDETIAVHLQQRPYTYMTNGLARLTDQALTQNAGLIQGMNSNGCNRMQLN
ncbi:hypothetical protein LTR28_008262, partial [Elasticomyces elasticus]